MLGDILKMHKEGSKGGEQGHPNSRGAEKRCFVYCLAVATSNLVTKNTTTQLYLKGLT